MRSPPHIVYVSLYPYWTLADPVNINSTTAFLQSYAPAGVNRVHVHRLFCFLSGCEIVFFRLAFPILLSSPIWLFSPPENDSFRKDLCFTRDVFLSTVLSDEDI